MLQGQTIGLFVGLGGASFVSFLQQQVQSAPLPQQQAFFGGPLAAHAAGAPDTAANCQDTVANEMTKVRIIIYPIYVSNSAAAIEMPVVTHR